MTNFAYIRISDANKQTTKSQEFVIKEYATEHGMVLEPKNIFTHKISGSKSTEEQRGWDEVIEKLKEGDYLLLSDVDRMGRDRPTGIMSLIDRIILKGATLIFCRSDTTFNMSCHNDVGKLFMMLGEAYAAVRFAEERSKKAKSACKQRASENLRNGRIKGEYVASKLDEFESDIVAAIADGVSKSEIAVKQGVNRATLYRWLEGREVVRKAAMAIDMSLSPLSVLKPKLRDAMRENTKQGA